VQVKTLARIGSAKDCDLLARRVRLTVIAVPGPPSGSYAWLRQKEGLHEEYLVFYEEKGHFHEK